MVGPNRYLEKTLVDDALQFHKMAFISGPRQVGKSTLARHLLASAQNYFSWDKQEFRRAWVRSPDEALRSREAGAIVLDELHKDRRWKTRLKGVYDTLGDALP